MGDGDPIVDVNRGCRECEYGATKMIGDDNDYCHLICRFVSKLPSGNRVIRL